jgi:hypothetical protein
MKNHNLSDILTVYRQKILLISCTMIVFTLAWTKTFLDISMCR